MGRGQSLVIPPYFDGTNYAYWKVHMKAFLKSLKEKFWLSIDLDLGWKNSKEELAKWDDEKNKVANCISRALNAIFSGISLEECKKISTSTVAKKVWTNLETAYEGTKVVNASKL